jgi:hypothetical protein
MDKPEAERTIINLKNVRKDAYERAKRAANRNDENVGEWVSRACDILADMEEGKREFGPAEPAKPRKPIDAQHVAALLQAANAARGNRHPAVADLRMLAGEMAREALGLDPRPVRLPPRRSGVAQPVANLGPLNGPARLIEAEPVPSFRP